MEKRLLPNARDIVEHSCNDAALELLRNIFSPQIDEAEEKPDGLVREAE